jgi:Glycosyl hydrolases family 38 C-terminal beta sandwich domain
LIASATVFAPPANSSDDLIARFYEWVGKEADVRLLFSSGIESASETNLIEDLGGPLAVHSQSSLFTQSLTLPPNERVRSRCPNRLQRPNDLGG